MRPFVPGAGLALVISAVLISGCGTASQGDASGPSSVGAHPAPTTQPRVSATPPMASLDVAEHEARDLGPVPANQRVTFTITLRRRAAAKLDALLAKGGRLTPAQWAASYGPAPAAVANVRGVLARGGMASRWAPGAVLLTVGASAIEAERFFHVAIDRYVMPTGSRFYGPVRTPAAPASVSRDVVAVGGLSDYNDDITAAIAGPNGVTPGQMTSFYNLTPLRSAGLDGSGVTVMFPEWAVPSDQVLDAFSSKFGLPAFNVQVVTNAAQWGAPFAPSSQQYTDTAGEAALDLEVVHGLAPGAKEIVYAGTNADNLPAMLEAMITAHPDAILSSSVDNMSCEADQGAKQDATQFDSVFAQAAAQGTSIFWAAGDRGAYACMSDDQTTTEQDISVQPAAASPHVTSVGGTLVFLASNGAYYKEAAWGGPLEQWGGGGGISTIFPRPSWQVAPGVGSISGRGIPDVSANADVQSGWDVFSPGQNGAPEEGPVGGTSAATPCWAAITALIDEDLMKQGLKSVGFANPTLYFFATNPSGLPAAPFHEITEGSNLHYMATVGWNAATGLGSPDVANLADDFEWFDKDHKGSV